ncbi:hypothetical protein P3T76_007332 [Phytophthora citrophthora]|uniref:Uncharacterized protein n=1 Tax=Phytophthora citrophthora TaxID=4793 RepID=A0AAD9GNP1_9STRA|nr:hypothetical protein P3T76_007329 [Phytophthora citrophthora]KAK1941466.1 hypothetical protein P3T76_007332 [Phytophthora citrophthora]
MCALDAIRAGSFRLQQLWMHALEACSGSTCIRGVAHLRYAESRPLVGLIVVTAAQQREEVSDKYTLRVVSYRIVSYRIVSYRIVSYRIVSCRRQDAVAMW